MATERTQTSYSPNAAIDKITNGVDAEIISRNSYKLQEGELVVAVYEKYFFRNNSTAALVVTAAGNKHGCTVDLVSTAAGQGLLNLGFGANESFIKSAIKALER